MIVISGLCLSQNHLARAVVANEANNTMKRNVFFVGVFVTLLGGGLIFQRFYFYSNNPDAGENIPMTWESFACLLAGLGLMSYACSTKRGCCAGCPCCCCCGDDG